MSNASDFIIENGVLKKYVGPGGDVVVPGDVKWINQEAFKGCDNLIGLELPDSVTRIGKQAFCGCENLANVHLGKCVSSVGDEAFEGCRKLENVVIPESVTNIGSKAFYGCEGLRNVVVPKSVVVLGDWAFTNCVGLADKNGYIVANDILYGYVGRKPDLVIPGGVIKLESGCLNGCKRVDSILIPETVKCVGYLDLGIINTPEEAFEILGVARSKKRPINILIQCDERFFATAKPWMKDAAALAWLTDRLACNVEFDNMLKKHIGRVRDRLFLKLNEDMEVALVKLLNCGKTTAEILQKYIEKCNDGKHPNMLAVLLDYQNINVPQNKAGSDVAKGMDIDEKSAKEWAKIYRWTEEKGGITLSKYKGISSEVEIPWEIEGVPVVAVGKNAFKGNVHLKKLNLTGNIVEIMDGSFEGCENLEEIVWGENMQAIGKRAFYGCYQLATIKLPEGLKTLGVNAFGCPNNMESEEQMKLSEVYLPESIKTFKKFLGEFYYYHVDVHFAGKKTELSGDDFFGAEVTLHVPAGSQTEEYAFATDVDYVAE